jgi:hypothetical protein
MAPAIKLETWLANEKIGILISCIIGFGIAALFRPMCKEGDCVVLRGPPVNQMRDVVYQMGGKCHEFTPKAVACPTDPKIKTVETFSFASTD